MKLRFQLSRDDRGAAAVEMAFALPILIVMLWAFVQLAQVYRAVAGMQQALGEGARYATLCINPGATGCSAPAPDRSAPAASHQGENPQQRLRHWAGNVLGGRSHHRFIGDRPIL